MESKKRKKERKKMVRRTQGQDGNKDTDLGKRMEAKIEKMQEMFNKLLGELKNKQR